MEKEELTRDINELIIKMSEYYGILGKNNNAIFKYLKDCEKALLDLLNEFNEKGEKVNKYIPFDNVFNYKSDYEYLKRDHDNLEDLYEEVCDELKEERYKNEKLEEDIYSLSKELEKCEKNF